jgi:excinuclease ABC subunit C
VFRRAAQAGRPCLLGYIDKCSAPCVARVTAEEHRAIAEDFCDFMAGDTARFVRNIERRMRAASDELDFETAARLRDDVGALRRALERSAVVLPDRTDADVYALADDELEVAVQVFHVRGGRVRGQRGWVSEKGAEDLGSIVEHLLLQVYGGERGEDVPREVLVPVAPADLADLEEWLSGLRGSRVRVRVPQRGDKRTLMQTVARNAQQALARHKVARSGDLTLRSQALQELQDVLDLDDAPLRIESFDISHVQGTDVVGSMVVFEDGLARKSEYRRFIVRQGTGDDTAAMHEVLTRRFRHLAQAPGGEDEDDRGDAKFRYPPNLVVVDGGLPQVNAAQSALLEVGVSDVTVIGLAKRLEEVWLPGQDFPVVLPRSSESLYLLQRVRDEAHRFANTFHRQRRSRSMTVSQLDGIPGLGPARQQALLARFGSVKALRRTTAEELLEVPGIGPAVAAAVVARLQGTEQGLAVNLSTGEVLD